MMRGMADEPTVFIVDDDPAMRSAMSDLVRSAGLAVETYQSAQAFLDGHGRDRPGCLVLDVRMPGMSGLELQDLLVERDVRLPLIMVTGYGNVPMAVRAIKAGAVAFLEKPFNDEQLLEAVRDAIEIDRERRGGRGVAGGSAKEQLLDAMVDAMEIDRGRRGLADYRGAADRWSAKVARLSVTERRVLELALEGKTNKAISIALDMTPKEVEKLRSRIMETLRER